VIDFSPLLDEAVDRQDGLRERDRLLLSHDRDGNAGALLERDVCHVAVSFHDVIAKGSSGAPVEQAAGFVLRLTLMPPARDS